MTSSKGPSGILTSGVWLLTIRQTARHGELWRSQWNGVGKNLGMCKVIWGEVQGHVGLLWIGCCQEMGAMGHFWALCLHLCSDMITEQSYCLDPSQSQSGLVRCRCSVKSFMANRRMPRPICECQASSQMSGAAFLSHTLFLLSLLGLLHSPQSSMIKFTLNPQFLHFWYIFVVCFSLEAYMQANDPHFTLFFPEFPFMKQKDTASLAKYLRCWEMISPQCSSCSPEVPQNTEYWLSQELSAKKLRKGSSFWEASQGSSPYTVIHLGSNFACKQSLQIHNFWNL